MSDQPVLPYNETGGYVNRPASQERAIREATDGTLSARQQAVLTALIEAGAAGATWRTIGQSLGLHHGQVSGALSNLHKAGVVFMLRRQENRCHPYVAFRYRWAYTDDQVWDEPVQTRAGQRKALLDDLHETCAMAVEWGFPAGMQEAISMIVDRLAQHDQHAD